MQVNQIMLLLRVREQEQGLTSDQLHVSCVLDQEQGQQATKSTMPGGRTGFSETPTSCSSEDLLNIKLVHSWVNNMLQQLKDNCGLVQSTEM